MYSIGAPVALFNSSVTLRLVTAYVALPLYTLMLWAPNIPAQACVEAETYQGWQGSVCTPEG